MHPPTLNAPHAPPPSGPPSTTPLRRRLGDVSRGFALLVAAAIVANLLFLVAIGGAFDAARAAGERRDSAMALVGDLRHETDLLARLVRAYVATADARYLMYYYDILAIRAGEKAAPQVDDQGLYWEHVIAGSRVHALPQGVPGVALAERTRRMAFDADEQDALNQVVQATVRLGKTEQVAFAATQGLYDAARGQFVSDGKPDLDFARKLVHGHDYAVQSASLADAVSELAHLTDDRTAGAVTHAAQRLRDSIGAGVAVDVFIALAVWFAWRGVRQRVLRPVADLASTAERYAAGDYDARVPPHPQGLHEFEALSRTLGDMAESIRNDLAARERQQRELEDARTQAEAATQAKSMFLANMSHEIRTPMNAIIGMTHLALATELDGQQRDYLDKVQGAATMLLGVLNDILDFSKIEAGKLELESVPCQLEEVVGGALMLLRERALHKGLELLCEVKDPALLADAGLFWGDPLRLGQVLVNLVSNAVKFTERGHVRLSVDLAERSGTGFDARAMLVFEVRDTGVGMTREQLGRLFQEFTQADGSTTRRYGGTGLGLSIARRLVQLMGGTLTAESEPGLGAAFTVRLPVRLAAREGEAPTTEASTMRDAGAAPARPDRNTPLGGLRVLVVDDQRETRATLLSQLVALGVGQAADGGFAEAVETGDEALARLEAQQRIGQPYDLVLLDWVLTGLDGGQVLQRLRASGTPTRVVVISAYGWDTLRRETEAAGADGFLAKPILPAALRRVLLPGLATPTAPRVDPEQTLRGLRVLLVEDNPVNRQLATELLVRAGASVDPAEHGRRAIERLERHGPKAYDLVLMDLQMPVMDGYAATRAIRSHAKWRELPILAMTAHAMVEERERCIALGMRGHIAKPLDPVALIRELAVYRPALPAAPLPATPPPAAATAPAPPPATPLPWPAWPHIDVPQGLKLCGGEPLLRNGLTTFALQYAGHPERLRAQATKREWDDPARDAHTLKGLGRQLGMTALADAAIALESALSGGASGPVKAAVGALADALAAVLRDLAKAPPWPAAALRPNAPAASPALWDELRTLLAAADSEVLAHWHTHRVALMAALPAAVAQALDQAILRCDFDDALLTAEAVA